jgi:Tol biopolymer transport system component
MLGRRMNSLGYGVGRVIFVRSFYLILFASLVTGVPVRAVELASKRDVSVAVTVGANGDSVVPWLSPDARFVLFSSGASDLVTNDNSWLSLDVFLRDRVSNTTTLISANRFQTGGGDGHSSGVCVSTNGRYVLFESVASDLVAGDTNELADVFVRDVQTETTTLVSVAAAGGVANNRSESAAMTPDGRYVAFISYATNLVTGDTNNNPDVFVRDLQTQTTALVSVGASNTTAGVGQPAISADGRWVAFLSSARNLVPGVSNISRGEIYLRDVTTGTTLWPSMHAIALVRSNMQFTSPPVPMHPVLSADGRYVTFACGWTNNASAPPGGTTFGTVLMQFDATTLTTTVIDTNGYPPSPFGDEVYGPEATPDGRFVAYAARVVNGLSTNCTLRCWDRQTGTSVGVSVDLVGGIMTNSASVAPVLSADGRYVTFVSDATNLVSNSISNAPHLYRRDLVANTTELVDADLGGVGSTVNLNNLVPAMSVDGRFVAYSAPDGNLLGGDDNGWEDVFVRDAVAATNELISVRAGTLVAQTGNAAAAPGLLSLSADGNRVAYAALATNLIAGDNNREADVFVWDRIGQSNQLVSVGTDGFPAQGGASISPQISADGRYVLFVSSTTNLVANDTNGMYDVFLRDLGLQATTRVSIMTNGVSLASQDVQLIAMTPDAQRVAFQARTNSSSATYPIFWRDLSSGVTRLIVANAANSKPPTLSSNGNLIAYIDTASHVAVVDAPAGTPVYTSTTIATSASLAPAGDRVLYQGPSTLYCQDLYSVLPPRTWASSVSLKSAAPWSPDGRYITFVTASSLVSSDTNAMNDVYLCDLLTGTLNLISATPAGTAGLGGVSDGHSFSADGRFIAYRSQATNLVAGMTAAPGLFVFDRVTGSNRLVAARSALPGPSWFSWPAINADGSAIAFKAVDAGLVAGDLNQTIDAFASSVSVLSTADGDADGIPDWWLQQYFGHTNSQANDLSRPGDDADDDGLTNHEEFLTGTNPMDAASALDVQITLATTGANVVLSWPAQAGKNYRVQYCDDVATGNWQNLTTTVQVAGQLGRATASRTNPTRVFRVRCEP